MAHRPNQPTTGIQACPSIYMLSVATLCCGGRAKQFQQKLYCPKALKYLLSGFSQKKNLPKIENSLQPIL